MEHTVLRVNTQSRQYDVHFCRGGIAAVGQIFDLDRKVLVVTDDGVPPQYASCVAGQCRHAVIITVPQGEHSKSFDTLQLLLRAMQENHFDRTSCVVAVGGGVVGDLAGFAAGMYMRGVSFYNIPTTTLSQIDSSVGGKTAINFGGIKNNIGSFYQPEGVLIDADLTKTLDRRQFASGLAEALKMGCIYDKELFDLFLQPELNLDLILYKSVKDKAQIVSMDEKEHGLRKILNFGHTIGHGYEAVSEFKQTDVPPLTHGECVGLGMLAVSEGELREMLKGILQKMGLPVTCNLDKNAVYEAVTLDKKKSGDEIDLIAVNEIGKALICRKKLTDLREKI